MAKGMMFPTDKLEKNMSENITWLLHRSVYYMSLDKSQLFVVESLKLLQTNFIKLIEESNVIEKTPGCSFLSFH